MYNNTKIKGVRAELNVMCRFTEAGFAVSVPFGDNSPYDLIVESPLHNLYRIQTRWCSWRSEILRVSLQSSSGGMSKALDLTRIDAVAAFDGINLYVIPKILIGPVRKALQLRKSASTKNGQKKGLRIAQDYLDRFDFLP